MIYQAYELKAYLNNLTLTENNGEIEWIGEKKDFIKTHREIENYEIHDPDNKDPLWKTGGLSEEFYRTI